MLTAALAVAAAGPGRKRLDASAERRKAIMEIKRSGSQPSGKGPADYFTGTVRIDPLFSRPSRRAFAAPASPSSRARAPPGTPIRSGRP